MHELGRKIFLDRYALKGRRENAGRGNTVIVIQSDPNTKFESRDVGTLVEKFTRYGEPYVKVRLDSGDEVEVPLEKIDLPIETELEQMIKRVAKAVASVEKTEENKKIKQLQFEDLMADFKFIPGGRILAGAGSDHELTYYNCYVLPSPHDSRQGIMKTLTDMAEIMSRGGGVGINLSTLRPRHAYVKGVNGRSSGSVLWGGLYSFVTGLIEQGGSRRGALMLILDDWHPDVFDFIDSKRIAGQITNANISVGISDAFMHAVKNDGDWVLGFPDTSDSRYDSEWRGDLDHWRGLGGNVVHYRTVKARDLWNKIIESAWASAEPGLWFKDRSNKMSNSWYFNQLVSTNPCGEQPLPGWGVCNLGALNLAKFYDEDTQDVNWTALRRATGQAVSFLDNVIDSTPYIFDENREVQLNERRVGLGTMGVAELLIKMGIRYGSDESVEFIEKLYKEIAIAAYTESAKIAAIKGSFPAFDADKFLQSGFARQLPEPLRNMIRKSGMRNVTLMTQAPTGSTGTMMNTSTGIEPFFSWVYYRKGRLGLHEESVPIVQEWREKNGENTPLPDYFVTAMDLTPEEHVKVQGAFQKWVDSAISKTCNVPNDYTVEQVAALYEQMYDLGCKGGTVYRDGSRDEQVLMLKSEDSEPEAETLISEFNVYDRPDDLSGKTYRVNTPFGKSYITVNNDKDNNPFEVFIVVGKAGSDIQADAEAIGRTISLALQSTLPENRMQMLARIGSQLRNIGGSRSHGFGPNRVVSVPDAIGLILQSIADEVDFADTFSPAPSVVPETKGYGDLCPQCGVATFIRTEGCRKCNTCGYSEC